MRSPSCRSRAAVTLIELLVVIAIIAVLVALTTAGVMRFMVKGPEMIAKNDISQMSIALEAFKTRYRVYPPSYIHLYSNRSMYSTAAEMESLAYLVNIWPKLDNFSGIAWDGSNTGAKYTLEPDQCLVYFLQGPPGRGGFSTNPVNPTDPNTDRVKFYEFNNSRLKARTGTPFLSYYDAYEKQPYLYFSSGRSKNINGGYVPAQGASLGVSPYMESATKFYRPAGFQIICAGIDGKFGPGGLWNVNNPAIGNGNDDFTNFHDKIMGVP